MTREWRGYVLFVFLLTCASARAGFTLDNVRAQAEMLSARGFHPVSNSVPPALLNLTFEQYDAIRFNDKKALWRGDGVPFCVEFFIPGFLHKQTVAIHTLHGAEVREVLFDPSVFENHNTNVTIPPLAGYSGFRIDQVATPLKEVAVFLDASYFRMIGAGQSYGTSARGLALDTAASQPEEFPKFQQYWIQRPQTNDRQITVLALMDSPSVAGAFRFVIRPGTATLTDVNATFFPRSEVKEFGIAPLTSMFIYGENSHPAFADFRPQVHDADGLLIHNGRGEWIWHPLEAGKMTRIDRFEDENPIGFGLIQRDRNFKDYQDLNNAFERRPSVWIRPSGKWGKGAVELVQLASDREASDNIVAFWVPAVPPPAHRRLDANYQLEWTTNDPSPWELGRVQNTLVGKTDGKPSDLRFVVEFGGPNIERLPAEEKPTADIGYGPEVKPIASELFKNALTQTWRMAIEIAEPQKAVNLWARLKSGSRPITETWNYTWQP